MRQMIELWRYHARMGQHVERLFVQAYFEREMGVKAARARRADAKFYQGEQWSVDELLILRRRNL